MSRQFSTIFNRNQTLDLYIGDKTPMRLKHKDTICVVKQFSLQCVGKTPGKTGVCQMVYKAVSICTKHLKFYNVQFQNTCLQRPKYFPNQLNTHAFVLIKEFLKIIW